MTRPRRPLVWVTLSVIALAYVPVVARSFLDTSGWARGDLHINYAGGFVRRGLLGALASLARDYLGSETLYFFGWLFLAMTVVQVLLLVSIARPLERVPALYVAMLLGPALLLFRAYDFEAYLRKDVFITFGLMLHASMVASVLRAGVTADRYRTFLYFVLAPYLTVATLIHEMQVFILPVHALLAYWALGRTGARVVKVLPVFIPALAAALLTALFRGGPETSELICGSWEGRAAIECDAIETMSWPYAEVVRVYLEPLLARRGALAAYALLMVLTAIPPLAVGAYLRRQGATPISLRLQVFAVLPALILFAMGWDWGRWIHMIGVALSCLVLSSAPAQVLPIQDKRTNLKAMAVAVVYAAAWSLKHCCDPRPIMPGLLLSLGRTARLALRLLTT